MVKPGFRLLPFVMAPFLACCGNAADSNPPGTAPAGSVAGASAFDHHLLVDQFGYRPGDTKVAVIRNPHVGYDSADTFSPGSTYEVRRADGGVVFTGKPIPWQRGAVEASSGDNGWWFDFSKVETPGRYTIVDVERKVSSAPFVIDSGVYAPILKAAMRMFFYQRSGIAKTRPHADACWVDDAAYAGPNQDLEAHDITDRDNRAKFKDVSGGWFDAGDTNKYVTFAVQPVHPATEFPTFWMR
jgi:hypothetical protein